MENYIDYLDQSFKYRILGLVVIIIPLFAIMALIITKSLKSFTVKQGIYLVLLYILIPNFFLFVSYWRENSMLLFILPLWYMLITDILWMFDAISKQSRKRF